MTKAISTNAAADPSQYFTLTVTFSDGVFSWQVVSKRSDGATGNVERNSIYGLTVNIGGNSIYIGDIDWRNYYVGNVIRSGSVSLSSCTILNGSVSISVQGNYFYGTWNTAYRCYGADAITIVSPTVTLDPNYTLVNDYNGSIVGGITRITFSISATPGTAGNTIESYRLYIDGVLAYSGAASTGTIVAPTSVGNHTVYAVAVESNGATGQSASVSITTVGYIAPSFTKVTSVRWSTGDNTGQSADDGTHAKLTPVYVQSKVGDVSIPTYCRVEISAVSYSGVVSASGNSLYTGALLSDNRSYTVSYILYDNFSGTKVVRTDTISIGGRCLDMIHDATDGYGVAAGMKATSGYFDTALPLRVVDIDTSGNITDEADINAAPLVLTSGVISRSSGKGIANQAYAQWGREATLTLVMSGDSTYRNVGDDIFTGMVANGYRPKADVMGVGYWDSAIYVGWLKTTGEIIVRLSGYAAGYTMNTNAVISWTYLI